MTTATYNSLHIVNKALIYGLFICETDIKISPSFLYSGETELYLNALCRESFVTIT